MKKFLSLVMAVLLVCGACLSFVSCSDDQIKVNPDKEKYTIGICQLVQHPALDAATQGFKDALTAALAAEGREVEFKEQNAQGDSTLCTSIVGNFVAADVDLILANATAALQAASNRTKTIPVLGTSITEYGVALGIDNFSGTVGGNVSGTCDLAPLTEQAQMMIDTLGLKSGDKVGLLYCSAEPNSKYQVNEVKKYLTDKGISCTDYPFSDTTTLQTVVTTAANQSDAIYVPTDNTVASNTALINNICLTKKVPVFAGEEGICGGCGYATLSISYYNIGKKTGEMAAKILLGQEDITTMPVAYDEAPVKKYNKAICDALGLTYDFEANGYTAIVTE